MSADPRGITLTTPLGPDALYLNGFRGREGLSQLFHFDLDLMAENRTNVAFDKLLGQKVTISILLPDSKTKRFWSGICSSLAQSGRDSTFTKYRMEVVPQLWLLTRRTQCRIFQHVTIPDILKKVLTGLDIKLELQGTFEPRDYCVQYRESDFDFASRLMEEEGIYYYFKHTDGGHQMVLGNSPQTHVPVIFSEKAIYEELQGGNRPDMRVYNWEKVQELRSGKVTLWDHCFELPHQHLDVSRPTMESVAIGKVTHKLKVAANEPLELYDYPGAFAQRFDGVDKGGGDKAGDLSKIFQDNKRTVAIRMEEEAAQAITLHGASNCRQFSAGHKFTLERHFDADGAYVITSVEHSATSSSASRSGAADGEVSYSNNFTCLPLALPYRPPCRTKEPFISGPQTAVVVGPPGEIIFCDKYGRIKVQFHWDREGKKDPDSSCWIRVSNNWGGANWGGMFLPHVGQEVIVEFEEGDPDRPLITGRVYNAECMPPLKLPDHKTKSAIRDHGSNEIIMEGDKGKEQIRIHSPHSKTTITMGAPASPPGLKMVSDALFTFTVGQDFNTDVYGDKTTRVKGNSQTVTEGTTRSDTVGDNITKVFGNYVTNVFGYNNVTIAKFSTTRIVGAETTATVGAKNELLLAANQKLTIGTLMEINQAVTMLKVPEDKLLAGKLTKKVASAKESIGKFVKKVGSDYLQTIGALLKIKSTTQQMIATEMLIKMSTIMMKSSGEVTMKAANITKKANVKVKKKLKTPTLKAND